MILRLEIIASACVYRVWIVYLFGLVLLEVGMLLMIKS